MPFLKEKASDTRSKIMQEAFELFGQHGFEGTSIRDIAKNSESNLAAVNYHFKSKENLFWEVMAATYSEVHIKIEQFYNESKNAKELSLKTYDYFLSEKTAIRAIMKMMLTDLKPPEDLSHEAKQVLFNPLGPPGGEFFPQMLSREINYELSREGSIWGIKAIFGVIHHWAVLCCCQCVALDPDPLMSEEQIRKDIESMIDSHIYFMKSQQDRFKK